MKCPSRFIHHTMKLIVSLVKETKIISSRMSSKKGQTVCGLNGRPYHTFDGISIACFMTELKSLHMKPQRRLHMLSFSSESNFRQT